MLCLFKHLSWPLICYYQTFSYLLMWLCLIFLNHKLFEGWGIVHTALPILKALEGSAYLNWLSWDCSSAYSLAGAFRFQGNRDEKSEDSLVAQAVKKLLEIIGDPGSIPGLGRSAGQGNGNLLQYSCLQNPMDGGAWVGYSSCTQSWIWLSD